MKDALLLLIMPDWFQETINACNQMLRMINTLITKKAIFNEIFQRSTLQSNIINWQISSEKKTTDKTI